VEARDVGAGVGRADVNADADADQERSRGLEPVRDGVAEHGARAVRERMPLTPLLPDAVDRPRTVMPGASVCLRASGSETAGGETEAEQRLPRRRGGAEELWALAARVLAQVQGDRLERGRGGPASWALGGWRFRPASPVTVPRGAAPTSDRPAARRAAVRGEPGRTQSGPDSGLDRMEPEALWSGCQGV
jgi:hypothetical protein